MGDRLYRCEKCDTLFKRKTGVDDRTICDTCFSHKANRKYIPSHERFGKEVLDFIKEEFSEGSFEIDVEALFLIALKYKLIEHVKYDSAIHKNITELEEGDMIWWWGENK